MTTKCLLLAMPCSTSSRISNASSHSVIGVVRAISAVRGRQHRQRKLRPLRPGARAFYQVAREVLLNENETDRSSRFRADGHRRADSVAARQRPECATREFILPFQKM